MHSAMFKDEIIHNRIFDPYMLQVGRAYHIKSDTNKFRNKNGGEYALLVKYAKDKLTFLTVRDRDGDGSMHPFFVAINIEDEQEWEIDRLFKE